MSGDDLEQRLGNYGDTLKGVLASTPVWQPPSGGGGSALGARASRWLGRNFQLVVAAVAALVITLVAFALAGGGSDSPEAALSQTNDVTVGDQQPEEPEVTGPSTALPSVDAAPPTPTPEDEVLAAPAAEPDSANPTPASPTSAPEATAAEVTSTPAPTASSAGELGCNQGTLVGSQCRIVGADPTRGPAGECKDLTDDAGCYRIEAAVTDCGLGESNGTGGCVSTLARSEGEQYCPDGFQLIDGACVQYLAVTDVCDSGVHTGDRCEIEGPAPTGGSTICPSAEPGATPDNCFELVPSDCGGLDPDPSGGCRQPGTVDTTVSCPDGMSPDGSRCVAAPVPTCPPGTVLEPDGCVEYVEPSPGQSCNPGEDPPPDGGGHCRRIVPPELSCTVGTLDGDLCVAPATTESICSATGGPVASEADCYSVVPASCGGLAAGPAGYCVQPVGTVTTPLECSGNHELIGSRCLRYTNPEPTCTRGTLDLAANRCEVAGSGPFRHLGECPTGDSTTECLVTYAPRRTCSAGTLLDNGTCRIDIDIELGPLECEANFILEAPEPDADGEAVEPACVRYVPAVRS